jgi:hypothetical protein
LRENNRFQDTGSRVKALREKVIEGNTEPSVDPDLILRRINGTEEGRNRDN